MSKVVLIVLLSLITQAFSQTETAPSTGDGTIGNPYQIATLNNLYWIAASSTRWGYDYIQTADIDASVTESWFSGAGWSPIGNNTTKFTGSYDGQQHIIEGLYINRPSTSNIGLFGYTSNANIKNLGVVNSYISGYIFVGCLVGYSYSSSVIQECNSSGTVISNQSFIGGLIGFNYDTSTIIKSYSSCNVYGNFVVGGLVGKNQLNSTINECYFIGEVNGNNYEIGGICGSNDNSSIFKCYTVGTVVGDQAVGGLVGMNNNNCIIGDCFTDVSIDGYRFVGGLVGQNRYSNIVNCSSIGDVSSNGYTIGGLLGSDLNSVISNSYSKASVTGDYNIGGLVGYSKNSDIRKCYSTGNVFANNYYGGLVGINESCIVSSCFWDIESSGMSVSAGGTGKTTVEMQTKSTFTNAGWDFVGESENGNDNIWNLYPLYNEGYPYLSWQSTPLTPLGEGTESNPYEIESLENLFWIYNNSDLWNKYFIQTSDIDATPTNTWFNGAGWIPIGNYTTAFTGSYNGQGHSINSLYINLSTGVYVGLFGRTIGSEISNLNLTEVNITGNEHVGGLAGYNFNFSTIENCSVSGSITGNTNTGGLVGSNWYTSSVSSSWSDCTVTGSRNTGGLVGQNYNSSFIDNCYSRSNVTAASYHGGGLTGQNITSTVSNSYSTGTVSGELSNIGGLIGYNNSTISNSFWDVETSGLTKSSGGIGKTTAEVKILTTFTNAGWDFTGETVNGTNDYWNIGIFENDGYPFLSWQIFEFEAPQNVSGSMSGSDFVLRWNEVSSASSYSVYSSNDPYAEFPSGWTQETSGVTGINWTDTNVTDTKMFYVVVAVNSKPVLEK